MNEGIRGAGDKLGEAADLAMKRTAGQLIRQAREGEGLHIGALAVSLKVPVKKLEALEADQLDLLPDAVFARALASSVCRILKIDATEILAALPQTMPTRLQPVESGINAAFNARSPGINLAARQPFSRSTAIVAASIAVAAAMLLLLPAIDLPLDKAAKSAPSPLVVATQAEVPLANQLTAAVANKLAGTVQEPSIGPLAAGVPGQAASGPALEKSKDLRAEVLVNAAPSTPATGLTSVSSIIVFKAGSDSWVEVTDSNRVVQARKTLGVGEELGVSGSLPLSVIVGRASTTEVHVRGKRLDLASVSKDNVARFEVKQ